MKMSEISEFNKPTLQESLEFLQLPDVQVVRVVHAVMKKIIEGRFPMADGLGFPIVNVGNRRFTYVEPQAIETEVAPVVTEKAECPVASLTKPTIPTVDTYKIGNKEIVTREAVEDAGWDIIQWTITRLTQRVQLPIEKAVIDAMKASTCQTAGATACWDATTGVKITKDLLAGRRALAKKGYPWNLHQLIVSGYDFSMMVEHFEGVGYLTEGVARDAPMALESIAKVIDMPVHIEDGVIGTTDILADTAIVHARDPDYGALFQRHPLRSRSWEDDAIEGARWLEISREILEKRIKADAVYTITNTVT